MGATVGAVIATKSAIIPAAVGVDIGCGMNAVRLSLKASDLPDDLYRLRMAIETAIPVGFSQHDARKVRGSQHARTARVLDQRLDHIVDKHPALMKMQKRFNETWICQLGTLGGGNHFIELCIDEEQHLCVMLHSGSRGLGKVESLCWCAAARGEYGGAEGAFRKGGGLAHEKCVASNSQTLGWRASSSAAASRFCHTAFNAAWLIKLPRSASSMPLLIASICHCRRVEDASTFVGTSVGDFSLAALSIGAIFFMRETFSYTHEG